MGTTPRGPRRHETRALLRAHLAAATRYRHATHHCPVCHRLLRLAMAMEHSEGEPAESERTDGSAHVARGQGRTSASN